MDKTRAIEIAVGLFVVAGLAALTVLAMRVSNITAFQTTEGYTVIGHFRNVGGLREGAPVKMGGVQVGRVSGISLDTDTYEARVELTIDSRFDDLPMDTSASVLTSGLLGEQYVGLEAGGMPTALQPGDELMLTQSAIVLEKIIGQFLYNKASGSDSGSDGGTEGK
ncbi:putative phospholipid ABC transporter-binding protein MlaD [wastewater metagenome]|uniref:Putative phospholipid ABC transporter-binding protein MlaD n=2 Tax=unclassified sequences TaxID=12908 RepID=A0A5B8RC30_9ZZZZ|nr:MULTISPECIES: outer membrane lipid asymmetry maintenance protein MlaD [Arhodomonas]MCS4504731.1 outer membrane lipid asymmetry maintenance protein MlaD [Arhodomonas aquaeolei]QEA04952.1 putative phospholipid ABC transporter-binding protein MlaD [uncultured organism]